MMRRQVIIAKECSDFNLVHFVSLHHNISITKETKISRRDIITHWKIDIQ